MRLNNASKFKPVYDNQSIPLLVNSSGDIVSAIKFPNEYLLGDIGNGNLELYSKGNTRTDINSDNINKTIYDPSPEHYKLPKSAAYTGFSDNNISGSFNKGFNYYTKITSPSTTIFMPSLGYRSYQTGSLNSFNSSILYNTAGPTKRKCWTIYYYVGGYTNSQHEEYRQEAHTTLCDKF